MLGSRILRTFFLKHAQVEVRVRTIHVTVQSEPLCHFHALARVALFQRNGQADEQDGASLPRGGFPRRHSKTSGTSRMRRQEGSAGDRLLSMELPASGEFLSQSTRELPSAVGKSLPEQQQWTSSCSRSSSSASAHPDTRGISCTPRSAAAAFTASQRGHGSHIRQGRIFVRA